MLSGKRIVLGVTGGIAAYKSALLVRECVRAGAEVQVVMSHAATRFIGPLTLGTLSGREVIVEMFPGAAGQPAAQWTRHIELGLWAEAMLIAPASANTIAKIAHGLADNFLTALVLALRCPLILAPAMDVDMWRNVRTQRNIALLREEGVHVIPPEEGELASGLRGPGRLPEPGTLIEVLEKVLGGRAADYAGVHVLVTAGPTQEPIDPVRYIGNRSSGKMGFAVASAASRRGAAVTLISGPVALATPPGVERIDVRTAEEMMTAVMDQAPRHHLVVMAAAVADFSPGSVSQKKIKRPRAGQGQPTLELRSNPDILKALGQRKSGQILVGFALETEDGPVNARAKLQEKHLDLIVLNNPLVEGAAFGGETNVVTFIDARGTEEQLGRLPKTEVAEKLLDRLRSLLPA
jgi:phosphopantothenoylcysteine decarboxylase/phosphopantothenate--cysteine ligase